MIELYKLDALKIAGVFVCAFKHKETGEMVIVSNSHLYWNPKVDYIKFHMAFELLRLIKEVQSELNEKYGS